MMVLLSLQGAGAAAFRGGTDPGNVDRKQLAAEFVETSYIYTLSLSPDGKALAAWVLKPKLRSNDLRAELVLVSPATGATREIDAGPPNLLAGYFPAFSKPVWSPNGSAVYFKRISGEGAQIWLFDCASKSLTQVTHAAGNVQRYDLVHGKLVFEVGPSREAIAGVEARQYENGTRFDDTVMVGSEIGTARTLEGRRSYARWVDHHVTNILGDATTWYELTGAGQPSQSLPVNDPDVKTVIESVEPPIVHDGRAEGGPSFIQVRVGGVEYKCSAGPCSSVAGQETRSDRGGPILFVGNDRLDHSSLFEWRPGTEPRTLYRSSGFLTGVDRQTPGGCPYDGQTVYCIYETALGPPRIVAISSASGSSRTIYDPNARLSRALEKFEARPVLWHDNAGSEYSGVFVRKRESIGKLPLVITSYRCRGFLRGGLGDYLPEALLASAGMVALCADAPPNFEAAAYKASLNGQLVPMQARLLGSWTSAISELSKRGMIDRCKVGVSGLSMGSMTVQYALAQTSEFRAALVQQGSDIDPISVLLYDGKPFDAQQKGFNLPIDPLISSARSAVSPALNASRITTPLLFLSAQDEYLGGLELYRALKSSGKPVDMYVYQDEFHHFYQPVHKLSIYLRGLDWMGYWLLGHPPTNYEDPETIAAWNTMRAHSKPMPCNNRALR